MKLLILTQAVDLDDPALGFFHGWIEEFAERCERVEVICLKEGRHALPANVTVRSLGKLSHAGVPTVARTWKSRIAYMRRFYAYIWHLRAEYDSVFVHMNPEYIVLGGVIWRLLKKNIALWYVHRARSLKLRIAVLLSHWVFTASKESMRIHTSKRVIIGHAINTALFFPDANDVRVREILCVGRITPIKRCMTLLRVAERMKKAGVIDFSIVFVGRVATEKDEAYKRELDDFVDVHGLRDVVRFAGAIPYTAMPDRYRHAMLSVNLAPTGGMDKAVLESIACATPAFVCNRAFTSVLGAHAAQFMVREDDVDDLANRLRAYLAAPDTSAAEALSKDVRERFALPRLISTILSHLSSV